MTSQEKYEYVAEQLDGSLSEAFAYYLSSQGNKLDVLYEMVSEWAESPKGKARIKEIRKIEHKNTY